MEHFKGATINASYLTPEQLIQRAAKLEDYIKGPDVPAPPTPARQSGAEYR